MSYREWKEKFVDSDKNTISKSIFDIRFTKKQGSNITTKQKFDDMRIVSLAYENLPNKVKHEFKDITFEFGYDGSACDIRNKIIRVGMGVSKEEIYHEVGHLIENYMMKSSDVNKYKEYLVAGLGYNDIITEKYYDTVGNQVDIFVIKGNCFESEYQSRLYVSDINKAVNANGAINVNTMGEVISEVFRKYMNEENISEEARKLLDGVI